MSGQADPAVSAPEPAAQIAGLIFAFLLIDARNIVCEANHATEDLLGISLRRVIGRPLGDVLTIGDDRVSQRLADPEAQFTARGLVLSDEAPTASVNMTISQIGGAGGWRVVTLSDAGQADMVDAAGSADLAASAVLAHEIKNPLSAIRGASQLLSRKLPDADQALARLVTDEVDRIARMIDRMQKLGSEHADPVEPVNLHQIVRNAMNVVRSAENSQQVTFVEEFDPSLPPVMASRDALQQVLINLIGNARDACAGGIEPCVTIRTRYVTGLVTNVLRRGRGRAVPLPIEIAVSDNGPGVDPSIERQIFDPFVTTKKGGQGLGLALVRKLVRDMDGRIAHERDKRAGLTRFRVHLAEARQEA